MGEISFNYLVILLCLIVNYTWLKGFDRFDDGWFFRFRRAIEHQLADCTAKYAKAWWISLVIIYIIPILVLVGLLVLLDNQFFSLPTMLLHILVLLIAFDRTQPGQMVAEFLERWRKGNLESCVEFLQEDMGIPDADCERDEISLKNCFNKELVNGYFGKIFAIFFWYMLAGPLGVVFNYISYQLLDSESKVVSEQSVILINWVIYVLEWIPIRLLGLTFSLASNFVDSFDRFKAFFWRFSLDLDSAELCAGGACP
jgi:AmpE protein|tara:strand:+ start:315 stop:1082 length:768 start_codon:yes stop_codon:yes gene_type:complete